jgi:quercetin dioxygenase-like cupin family protein
MDDGPRTYRVITDGAPEPTSDAGREALRSLLGLEDGADVSTFSTVISPGTRVGSHRHTAAFAAGVVSGSITFVFGADGEGRFDLSPGHYVWVDEGVVHDEETTDGVELFVAHVDPLDTLTD